MLKVPRGGIEPPTRGFQSPQTRRDELSFLLWTSAKHTSRPVKAGTLKHGRARSADSHVFSFFPHWAFLGLPTGHPRLASLQRGNVLGSPWLRTRGPSSAPEASQEVMFRPPKAEKLGRAKKLRQHERAASLVSVLARTRHSMSPRRRIRRARQILVSMRCRWWRSTRSSRSSVLPASRVRRPHLHHPHSLGQ